MLPTPWHDSWNWRLIMAWLTPHHSWNAVVLIFYKATHSQSENTSWGCLWNSFMTFWNWRRWLSVMYSHWKWVLGTLILVKDKACQQVVATFFLIKSRNISYNSDGQRFMLTFFWDCKASVVEHSMSRGTTINNDANCDLLENYLKLSVRSKCCILLHFSVLLQHNKLHTACSMIIVFLNPSGRH